MCHPAKSSRVQKTPPEGRWHEPCRRLPAAKIVVGASTVRYRDFIVGTILGMGAMIITLAGFGIQLTTALRSPSPATVVGAILMVSIPLTLAWVINRSLRPRTTA